MRPADAVVAAGSGLSGLLSAHALVNARLLRRPSENPPATDRRVSICIPARDEAGSIGPCIEAVLGSIGVGELEVLVLDDGSTDTTGSEIEAMADRDPRCRLLRGGPLPGGWLGKPNACQQLGDAATGDVLVFIDADVRLAPHAIAATVDLMARAELALASPYPRQLAQTPAERLVQPLLQWLWLTFLPLRLAERPWPVSMAAANGQFLAIDRATYRAIGGHGAVRNAVIEDVWLARAVKQAGGRAGVVDGTGLATCRMYDGWTELRDGYTKSLWAVFGSPVGAVAVGALLGLAYLVPPAGAVVGLAVGRSRLAAVGAVGYLVAVGGRAVSARRTGGRVADAAAHPLSIAVLLGLLARSRRHRRLGLLRWKGRSIG